MRSERPFVSFVFPVHVEGAPLLRRALDALECQTDWDFEVVVAVDARCGREGRDPSRVGIEAGLRRPFRVRRVTSQRQPAYRHLPHRNHARNAGCNAAEGEHLWVLDADMIPDPRAVEHLKAIVSSSSKPTCVSPCFAEPDMTPEAWLAYQGDPWAAPRREYVRHSGRLADHVPGPARAVRAPSLVEGFPSCPRWLWEALGGYEERFLAYGGNKVDFVRQLTSLDSQEGLVEVHMLRSCLFLHQPHERDPLRFDESHRARNWELYRTRRAEMVAGAPWWREKVSAVRAAVGRAA